VNRLDEVKAERDALRQQIKTAYRKLSFLVHPDRGGSHTLMTALNEYLKI